VAIRPTSAEARSLLGVSLHLIGDVDGATRAYEDAIGLAPSYVWPHSNLMSPLLVKRDFHRVIAEGNEAIRLKPDNAVAWRHRAQAYRELGQWDKVIADYSEALRANPNDVETWRNRAEHFISIGLLKEAAADLAKAYELEEPDDALRSVLHALLRVYVSDGPGYRDACRRMLARFEDSTNSNDWINVAAALGIAPEPGVEVSRAVALAERAVADNKLVWRMAYLGLAHYRAGQFEQAESALEESLAIDPNWNPPMVHSALGMTHHRLGNGDQASAALAKAKSARDGRVEAMLAGDVGYWPCPWWDAVHAELLYNEAYALIHDSPLPEDPRLVAMRGRALEAIGRADEGRAEFGRAVAMRPDDVLIRMGALPPVGRTDEFVQGLADLRAFLKEHPEQPEGSRLALARAHLHWGAAQWNAGRRQETETAFNQAIAVAPQNAQLFLERGNLWVDFGEFARAIGDYSKTLEQPQGPDSRSAIYHQRGLAHSRLGHYPEARDDFAKVIELDPDNVMNRYWEALAHAAAGDLDGYKRACAAMIEHFGQSDKPEIGYWVAWTAVLAPAAVADMTVPITLAEMARTRDPQNSSFANTVGATLFRAGRFDEAVQRLSAVSTAWDSAGTKPTMYSAAYTRFFLAMAHHRLGHAEEGRQWFDKAVQQMDEETQNENVAWNRRATLQLFRQEAQELLKK
jgi:tetratricopeptide (TPR) repeat protein